MFLPPFLRFWPVLTCFGPIHIDFINMRWAKRNSGVTAPQCHFRILSSVGRLGSAPLKQVIDLTVAVAQSAQYSTPSIWGWFYCQCFLWDCGLFYFLFGLPHDTHTHTFWGRNRDQVVPDWRTNPQLGQMGLYLHVLAAILGLSLKGHPTYPLVMTNITMDSGHSPSGFCHSRQCFSIAMFVYKRVGECRGYQNHSRKVQDPGLWQDACRGCHTPSATEVDGHGRKWSIPLERSSSGS